MADGFFVGIELDLLPDYVGSLSNALIPVMDATTKNKYKIKASDVLVGGQNALYTWAAAGGTVETISFLNNKDILAVFRGSSFGGSIITTGTPAGFEIKWNQSTNELTAPAGDPWLGGETLNIIYKV